MFVVGCHIDLLKFVGMKSVQIPNEFALHANLQKIFSQAKARKIESGEGIDWATAEAMAIGTLLLQGMFRIFVCVSFSCLFERTDYMQLIALIQSLSNIKRM